MTQAARAPEDAPAVLKCDLASEVLRSFGGLRFAATGWSMLPTFWPGDTLVVARVRQDQVCVGDVVLVGRNGRLCAHRLVSAVESAGNPHWITQGDAMPVPDPPVTETQLLGRVNYVIRAGKSIPVSSESSVVERLIKGVVRRSFPVARALVYLHGAVQASEKSALRKSVLPCQG